MTPERWRQVTELFHVALSHDASARARYLDGVCADDTALRDIVDALLAVHDDDDPFGPRSVGGSVDTDSMKSPARVAIVTDERDSADGSTTHNQPTGDPRQIGPYRLLQKIGEGGMGEVWLAEQQRPVRRQVAVKIIKTGMDTSEIVARFEAERQALAVMNHPGIARMLDGGSTREGRPYFVMEYVPGVPITTHCDQGRLSISARLELFLQVCSAVQHAHQKAIIHRDLKPSNVLVVIQENQAVPKIIDFGIAKATAQRLTDKTMFTQLGAVVGTPVYMSPEQAEPTGQDIDTRTDVYALGVMLYELLTGVTPIDVRDAALFEIQRRIREEEPIKPSVRITRLGDDSDDNAQVRRTTISNWRRELSGDLDWITMKALEKDRTRRYGSPSELAADIERYLTYQPVLASPPSPAYRARRFVRRHRLGVGMAAAFAALLTAAVVVSSWMAIRASRAEQEARAVSDFLRHDLLAQASALTQAEPETKPDPDLTVRTALDRAAARIDSKFADQPLIEASIRHTIGETFDALGLYEEAQRQLERALDLRTRLLGERHADTLTSMDALGVVHEQQGLLPRAESLLAEAVEGRRRALGEEHPDTLASMTHLGFVYRDQAKYAEAESLFTRILEVQRRVLGEDDPMSLLTLSELAALNVFLGKYARAETLFTQALDTGRRVLGEEHPETLVTMSDLGVLYRRQGQYARAQPLYEKSLEISRRVLGEEHGSTLTKVNNLGVLYTFLGRYRDAETLLTSALDGRRRTLGEDHPDTLNSMRNLARLYQLEGTHAQGEPLITGALERQRRVLGEKHPETLISMRIVALIRQSQSKYSEAESLLIQVLDTQRSVLGDEHPETLTTTAAVADLHAARGNHAEAEALLTKVYMARRQVLGEEQPDTVNVLASVGRARLRLQKYAEAEQTLRDALKTYERTDSNAWERYDCQSMLGASLAGQKKYAEAESLLLSGYDGLIQREATIPAIPVVADAIERLDQLYTAWENPVKAAEWRRTVKAGTTTPR